VVTSDTFIHPCYVINLFQLGDGGGEGRVVVVVVVIVFVTHKIK